MCSERSIDAAKMLVRNCAIQANLYRPEYRDAIDQSFLQPISNLFEQRNILADVVDELVRALTKESGREVSEVTRKEMNPLLEQAKQGLNRCKTSFRV